MPSGLTFRRGRRRGPARAGAAARSACAGLSCAGLASAGLASAVLCCAVLCCAVLACAAPAEPDPVQRSTAGIEPRFVPALEALQSAVGARDDELARRIHARLMALGPEGSALEMAQAFERILDGREALRRLELTLECLGVGQPAECRVRLVARARDGAPLVLHTGPGALRLAAWSIDGPGNLAHSADVVPIPPGTISLAQGEVAVSELARVPLGLPPGALALRLAAELELGSGSVEDEGRALPARRAPVGAGEIGVLAGRLLALGPAEPAELARLARAPGATRERMIECAVRLPRAERARALDLVAELDLDPAELEPLAAALAWLDPDAVPGGDARAWAGWLAQRARALRAERERALPRPPGAPAPN